MIYLQHTFAASGLAVPMTVSIVVDEIEWLVTQVQSEMQALFPDARIAVNPATSSCDLLVVVYPAGTQPEDRLGRLADHVARARTGVALYCVDDRRFELVASGDLRRWTQEQRRRRLVLDWSRRAPSIWNRVVRRLVAH